MYTFRLFFGKKMGIKDIKTFYKMSFEDQKIKVLELKKNIEDYRRSLDSLEKELQIESNKLIELCDNHIWVRDTDSYDHHSHHECARCGCYR